MIQLVGFQQDNPALQLLIETAQRKHPEFMKGDTVGFRMIGGYVFVLNLGNNKFDAHFFRGDVMELALPIDDFAGKGE